MDPLRLQQRLAPLLAPLGGLYGAAMRVRRTFLEQSRSRFICSCPCVSVGNIAWGGTGKTPVVEWLLHWAARERVRTAVLSRGYGTRIENPPVHIMSTHEASQVGDEPLMLALSSPEAAIIVDPVRRRAAEYAMRTIEPDLVVLDDGFQHLPVQRDLDLVLLRPSDLEGQWNMTIPAGSWREPVSALERAGAFLVKCPPHQIAGLLTSIENRLKPFDKPVFSFHLKPKRLRRVDGTAVAEAAEVSERPYTLLTGVGEPDQVRRTVSDYMGYEPEQCLFKPDHYRFTDEEIQALSSSDHLVVCTAKDAVKLRGSSPTPNLWYLETDVEFEPVLHTDHNFPLWWSDWWRASRP